MFTDYLLTIHSPTIIYTIGTNTHTCMAYTQYIFFLFFQMFFVNVILLYTLVNTYINLYTIDYNTLNLNVKINLVIKYIKFMFLLYRASLNFFKFIFNNIFFVFVFIFILFIINVFNFFVKDFLLLNYFNCLFILFLLLNAQFSNFNVIVINYVIVQLNSLKLI